MFLKNRQADNKDWLTRRSGICLCLCLVIFLHLRKVKLGVPGWLPAYVLSELLEMKGRFSFENDFLEDGGGFELQTFPIHLFDLE